MPKDRHRHGLFPALLKHWRGQRGLSQLDLAIAADVSGRHVSFLETGRSAPSRQMILRLGAALDIPLRQINEMLRSAEHEPAYPEPDPGARMPPELADAIELMKAHHAPYPLVVINRLYDVVDANVGAQTLFALLLPELTPPLNLVRATFDPSVSEALVNFDEVGQALLWRLQREVLADPNDGALRALLDEIMLLPTVHERWRQVDLAVPASPALVVHIRLNGEELRFVTMVTCLQAPQTVLADELRIETWFPADEATSETCGRVLA